VPELRDRSVGVIVCAATADALDRLVAPGHGARLLRVAPDEAMAVVEAAYAEDVRRELEDRIAVLDDDALVMDVSDGWAAIGITGPDADRSFSYLSALEPPSDDGFVQGDVARVAAKVARETDGLLVLVPAYWAEHLRARAAEDAGAQGAPR
jgi:glycine cleavage system aminomethyltransferase T